jgi:hypothetical protein
MFNTVTAILGIALGVLLIGDLALIIARLRWYYWAAPRLRPIDQTHLNVAPSDALRQVVDGLSALGFSRLGEAGLPQGARLSGPVQIWYFADRDRTTIAGTFVTNRPHAILYSWFGLQAVVVTAYPVGDTIERPNYRYHTIGTTLAEAYHHHVAQLADFQMRFGDPIRFDSMAKVIELDRHYNHKFSRLRGLPTLWRTVGTSAFQLYLMLVVLGTVIAVQLYWPPALDVIAIMGGLIVLGGGLYWIARQRWG